MFDHVDHSKVVRNDTQDSILQMLGLWDFGTWMWEQVSYPCISKENLLLDNLDEDNE